MAFVRHTETRKSFLPRVSLSPTGYLSFTEAAVKRYGMKDVNFVVLFFDEDTQRVGVMLTSDQDEPGVMKLRHRDQGGYVAAKSFLGRFQINLKGTTSYPLELDTDSEFLTFDLTKGRLRNAGAKDDDDAEE